MKKKIRSGRLNRYSRQTILKEVGVKGQERLKGSRVGVVGCGALGTYISSYLVRAGVGEVVIIDRDIVELNNLQRQALFDENDIGVPKVTAAASKLRSINSEVKVTVFLKHLNSSNICEILDGVDIIIDGTDNFRTRYLINDYSISRRIPWIYSGVIGTEGVVSFFRGEGPCLRCLLEDIPKAGEVPTCESSGILNSLPPLVTGMGVTQCFKFLIEGGWDSRIFSFDPWRGEYNSFTVDKSDGCLCCGEKVFNFLNQKRRDITMSLCEKGFQIIPAKEIGLNLKVIGERIDWDGGVVNFDSYMLVGVFEGIKINLFSDGRAIIKGLKDEGAAESFYSRIVGV